MGPAQFQLRGLHSSRISRAKLLCTHWQQSAVGFCRPAIRARLDVLSAGWAQHVSPPSACQQHQCIGAATIPGGAGPGLQVSCCIAGLSKHQPIRSSPFEP